MAFERLERCEAKVCAVRRIEGIITKGDRSSGQMTSRRTPYLNPKGGWNKSMDVKREISEDVYGIDPQRLHDMVKAILPELLSPVVEPHTHRYHVCRPDAIGMSGINFLPDHALAGRRCAVSIFKGTNGAPKSCYNVFR